MLDSVNDVPIREGIVSNYVL